jgi:hypothetical protein
MVDFCLELLIVSSAMKRKERYIARPDEVEIVRRDEFAEIHYKEEGIPVTHLGIGPEVKHLTDEEIVELHNESLRAQAKCAADYKHVALEVPLGSPQIEYSPRADQWVPRGSVLRCHIEDDSERILTVGIDDHELTLEQFGKMLTTYSGWGMRIEFVPEDELHRRPAHQIREPAAE